MSDVASIISQLEKQRTAIERAISALREVGGSSSRGASSSSRSPRKRSRKRHISPEGRARIAEASRKRWADKRAADAKKASGRSR